MNDTDIRLTYRSGSEIRILDGTDLTLSQNCNKTGFKAADLISLVVGLMVFFFVSSVAASSKMEVTDQLNNSRTNSTERDCSIVILGASYAAHWDIDRINGCQVINKGLGGNQSFEMFERFDRDVISYDPDYVLIWGFINDIFRSEPSELIETRNRIDRNFISMIEKASEHGIRPILATEITMGYLPGLVNEIVRLKNRILGKTEYVDFINSHVAEINSWIKKYSSDENLLFLDLHKALADSTGNRKPEYLQPDGSHVSVAGYEALTRYMTQLERSGYLTQR